MKSNLVKKDKVKKVALKQIEQAQNKYIVENNNVINKIIAQDFSGKKITKAQISERKADLEKIKEGTIALNNIHIEYVYNVLQDVLKKNNLDGMQLHIYFDEETQGFVNEYDYFLEVETTDDQREYNTTEEIEDVEYFLNNLEETLDSILIDLSKKVLTEDDSIYMFRDYSLEDFKATFNVEMPVEYTIEISID